MGPSPFQLLCKCLSLRTIPHTHPPHSAPFRDMETAGLVGAEV